MTNYQYDERYCLFVDILGFKSHIVETVSSKDSNNSTMSFNRLHAALKEISEEVQYREKIQINGQFKPSSREVTQFSDSIIVSYLKKEDRKSGVSSIHMDVHNLQRKLIHKGILLRGAVTSGLLFHNKDFVFGPALNEAVALERLASYPRVILDGEILDEARLNKSKRSQNIGISRTISSMVKKDFDGLYYVDYFDVHSDDFDGDWSELSNYLEKLRELIKGLSAKRDLSIKVKHSWLRTKFNTMVTPFQESGFLKLGVHKVPEKEVEIFRHIKPF